MRTNGHLFRFAMVAGLVLTGLVLGWRSAVACACCADPGRRLVVTEPLDRIRIEEINQVRFDATAHLYLTSAGIEGVKGIAEPSDSYALEVTRNPDRYDFDFRNESGRSGRLTLPMPKTISVFEVDTHENPRPENVSIYKEWTLTSRPAGSGIFSGGTGIGQSLSFILHGRGNLCPSAVDFSHWTLMMRGPRASYLFYGKLLGP